MSESSECLSQASVHLLQIFRLKYFLPPPSSLLPPPSSLLPPPSSVDLAEWKQRLEGDDDQETGDTIDYASGSDSEEEEVGEEVSVTMETTAGKFIACISLCKTFPTLPLFLPLLSLSHLISPPLSLSFSPSTPHSPYLPPTPQ